jgi:protein-S-isoprenylcysteine O-methyltransferase Ste14
MSDRQPTITPRVIVQVLLFVVVVPFLPLLISWRWDWWQAWALIENPFFSGMVRIQQERHHRVVSSGPYGWVRHPGYAGALLTYVATPLFLDALWASVPVALLAIALVIRTHLEDQTLQEQLAGYQDYAQQVRHRLLPGIW